MTFTARGPVSLHLWNYEPYNEGPAHNERLIVHYEGLGAHNGTMIKAHSGANSDFFYYELHYEGTMSQ